MSEGFAVPGNSRSPEEGRAYRARFQQKATHGAREQGPSECCGRGIRPPTLLFAAAHKRSRRPLPRPDWFGTSVRRFESLSHLSYNENNPDYRAYSLWSVAGEGFEPPIFWLCVPTTVFTAIIRMMTLWSGLYIHPPKAGLGVYPLVSTPFRRLRTWLGIIWRLHARTSPNLIDYHKRPSSLKRPLKQLSQTRCHFSIPLTESISALPIYCKPINIDFCTVSWYTSTHEICLEHFIKKAAE